MTSIEFRPVGTFTSTLFSTQKSARRAVRDGVVTASATLFVPQRGFLFVGLTDGKIICWETDRYVVERKTVDGRTRTLEGHKGSVKCMIFAEALCNGVMFTGSADRCIKMWDLSDPRGAIPCVHSLFGHGGTVLAVEFAPDLLLSSSTDGFMFVWRDQSPARLLRFPAYSVRQKLTPDTKGVQTIRGPKELWFLSMAVREGEPLSIFAGDSEGYMHIYKPDVTQSDGGEQLDEIFLLAWKVKIHELGILRIMTVPMESFVFTLSFDQKFKALDSLSGQVIFEESNQCGVVFNSIAWDSATQDAIVVDERGNIGFYNLYMESCVVWRNLTEDQITQVVYEPSTHRLLLLSPHVLRVMDVVRGVKFSDLTEHTGPVVAMAPRPTPQGGLLYSASMDNTIRLWDSDAMECLKCLRERKQEITAMVYLPRANAIVTGHENSDLKIWSVDCQQEAQLRTVSGHSVHENTISALVAAAHSSEDTQQRAGGEADLGVEILVAGSYDRQLSFWKVTLTSDGTATAKFDRAFLAHSEVGDEVLAVAYSQAAGAVFTGGNAGVVRKWDLLGPTKLVGEYEGHEDSVVCFAVDGHFLYSGSADCTVRIWETSQGYELKVVSVHEVTVQALLVVPDSGFVASCGFDGRLVFWDPRLGKGDVEEIQAYEQHEEFRSLAYVDLNRSVLVGCESGKIIAFPLPKEGTGNRDELPQILCGLATPPSSRAGDSQTHRTLEALRTGR